MSGDHILEDAIVLAAAAHRGQFDKAGMPYILHPLRVMQRVEAYEERIAAVLHDTVEDGGVELRLIRHRFGERIADAVDALSRRIGESYSEFIARCAGDPIARVVKLADLYDNLDRTRIPFPSPADEARWEKYTRAKAVLLKDPGQ